MAKIDKAPLTEKAYRQIKDQIITLTLKPGAQLDERTIADKLGIGITPVKGAILKLAGEGLVNNATGRGYWVRNISIEDVRNLFETMMVTECPAMALAARRITNHEIENLSELNEQLRDAMRKQNYLAITRINSKFHCQIYRATCNSLFNSQLSHLQTLGQRLAYMCFSELTSPFNLDQHYDKVIQDHNEIIEALKVKDEIKIIKVAKQHILLFYKRVSIYSKPQEIQQVNLSIDDIFDLT